MNLCDLSVKNFATFAVNGFGLFQQPPRYHVFCFTELPFLFQLSRTRDHT